MAFKNKGDVVDVKVSAASLRLPFIQCGPDCIAEGCGGNCCDAPSRPDGLLVTIHPTERARIEALGGVVRDGLLQAVADRKGCPFKRDGLCSLHGTPAKPFGCIASPFTVNANGTLIVRNRYKMLPCYRRAGSKRPAHKTFFASLEMLFGKDVARVISDHLDHADGDLTVPMPRMNFEILRANDRAKSAAK